MTTANRVLDIARGEIGTVESPPNSNRTPYGAWYGLDGPWCAMFVSWVFHRAGLPLPASTAKGFAYTPSGAAWFRRQSRWCVHDSDDVRPGDVVFFYWPNQGRIAHVGIVEVVHPDGTLTTIEGNTDVAGGRTGGRVMRQRRSRATVHPKGGFGHPDFTEEDFLMALTEQEQRDLAQRVTNLEGAMHRVEQMVRNIHGAVERLDPEAMDLLTEIRHKLDGGSSE